MLNSARLRPRIIFLGLVALVCGLAAGAVAADSPRWLRYPALSPDGQTIVFAYKGDLYSVPATGGRAVPLTLHEARDFAPFWSRDGKQLAFASDRTGNFDVFVMPAAGGEAQRLTFHSAHDIPSDFSPDGKEIIFSSQRLDAAQNMNFPDRRGAPELYAVKLDGGLPTQVLTTPAIDARWDRKGERLVYHDQKGFEDNWRKHHTSSIARDVWLYERKSGKHTKLTDFAGEDRNPVWSPDESSLYFLSERGGDFNVWRMDPANPGAAEQVTGHKRHPVRFLTMSTAGALCYSWNGDIYLRKQDGDSRKVAIEISVDERRQMVGLHAARRWRDRAGPVRRTARKSPSSRAAKSSSRRLSTATTKRITSTAGAGAAGELQPRRQGPALRQRARRELEPLPDQAGA